METLWAALCSLTLPFTIAQGIISELVGEDYHGPSSPQHKLRLQSAFEPEHMLS